MAFGDDAQNTWDKQENQQEFHEQLEGMTPDGASNAEIQEATAGDRSFHESLDAQMAATEDMEEKDLTEAELDSDLDYDTALGEADGGTMDRDSAA